ncbi:MAG: hypothetical protein UV60_C0013G0008 [Parcubacteria group bacterium GW2011_GWA2_43_11]|nr:MAG: hypothetical protein UV60_C0013G0008 [Parcubacteria group bacterium GW2011_GWA2_43_11]
MEKKYVVRLLAVFIFALGTFGLVSDVTAQETVNDGTTTSTSTATSSQVTSTDIDIDTGNSLLEAFTSPKQDLTKPEEEPKKTEIQTLLEKRPVKDLGLFNFLAYWVQKAISLGIPANTIVLIFLIPVIATLIAFVRVVIGLPSLEMLVPIVLAFAFVAVGITAGLIILSAVVLASFVSRTLLRSVPIMYFPKRSLSHLFLAVFVFAALTVSIILELESIRDLSIFPVLILTLLGDSIVSVQLRKTVRETILITSVTIGLALIGYLLATSSSVRDALILWPEVILLTVPVNFMLGRYFGLRLAEVLRFRTLESYASE